MKKVLAALALAVALAGCQPKDTYPSTVVLGKWNRGCWTVQWKTVADGHVHTQCTTLAYWGKTTVGQPLP